MFNFPLFILVCSTIGSRIRHPLVGHSVLYSLNFLQLLLIFSCARGPIFFLHPWVGHAFAAATQACIGQFHSPCVAPYFWLQLVPSLRNLSDFTPEFFFLMSLFTVFHLRIISWLHC